MSDLRFAVRQLIKTPGFTLVAVVLPARRAARINLIEALRSE